MIKVNDIVTVTDKSLSFYGSDFKIISKLNEYEFKLSNDYLITSDQVKLVVKEAVNSPSHYNAGRVEIIEVIEDITKGYKDAYIGYLIGNTLKYISRAPHKHDTPLEDLRKAEYHLKKAIERLSN